MTLLMVSSHFTNNIVFVVTCWCKFCEESKRDDVIIDRLKEIDPGTVSYFKINFKESSLN